MDPYSSLYITKYSSFQFLFHCFIPSQPKVRFLAFAIICSGVVQPLHLAVAIYTNRAV